MPTSYQDLMALLKSDELRAVENPIAAQVGMQVLRDDSAAVTTSHQAEIGLSGLTTEQLRQLLHDHRDELVAFGVAFLRDSFATADEEEFPPGEEQDLSEGHEVVLGLASGFGVTYTIYLHFLKQRDTSAFREFLKARRIPKHTQFARELWRVYEGLGDGPLE